MFNLLNGEFCKLQKSRSFFVCCIAFVGFIIFMYSCLKMTDELDAQGEQQAPTSGFVVVEADETLGISDMEEMMLSFVAVIFLPIFACIFVTGEYEDGAVKNIMGKGFAREKIFLAKYLITIFATVIMFLMILLVTLLCGLLFVGTDSVNAEFVQSLCKYGGMQLLFEIAFASLAVLVGEIGRNVGIGVAFSLGLLMLGQLIFAGFDALLSFINVDFKTSDYWVGNLISGCPITGMEQDFIIRGFAAAAFWIIVALGAGILHIKTADVK